MNNFSKSSAYESLFYKLDQHEKTITQLLEIIAVTNRKLFELERKQMLLEQQSTTPQAIRPRFAPTKVASVSSYMPQINE